jgi:hypothetical protein
MHVTLTKLPAEVSATETKLVPQTPHPNIADAKKFPLIAKPKNVPITKTASVLLQLLISMDQMPVMSKKQSAKHSPAVTKHQKTAAHLHGGFLFY